MPRTRQRSEDPVEILRGAPGLRDLAAAWRLRRSGRLRWGGFWGSSRALFAAALNRELEAPGLILTRDAVRAALFLDDLLSLGAGAVPFPAREGGAAAPAEVLQERHHALELAGRPGFSGFLVAPLAALLQPAGGGPEAAPLALETGMRLDLEDLLARLVGAGFERVPALHSPGEVARRGDILDFFAPAVGEPLRLEFLDDELESIRVFDIASQRTRHVLEQVSVPLARDLPEFAGAGDRLPLEELPEGLRIYLDEPQALDEAANRIRLQGAGAARALGRVLELLEKRPALELATMPGSDGAFTTLSVEEYCRGVAEGAALLAERAAAGERAVVFCATETEAERLAEILRDQDLDPALLDLRVGGLNQGFRVPEARLTVLHHRELVPGHGAHRPRSRKRRSHEGEGLQSLSELKPGDLVVHAVQGLCLYRGLEPGEDGEDRILLEFAEGALMRLPASRVDLVERYIGSGGGTPELDRLGSGAFLRRRKKVEAAVEDLAAEMLEIQARRQALPGTAFPLDAREQRAFEAAFPYEDTPDQAQATREIHADLGEARAMDRLLCGDVGYGKTELAARAAFRVILAGWQAAFLVPTTVLAEQHARTLRERFAAWPVRVEQLSRIVPPRRRREVLQGLEDGSVDLVVGTHRLLSRDVRFRRLGLVVIDEEQRFGVRAKEQLKKKRLEVDVLTLSATPIPRTLHMAMAGIRDISSLSTPPRGRLEVHTEIHYQDEDELIARAIRDEMGRGGQVFFVHNRIVDLDRVASRLQRLVPEARIATGHGQMEPRELEKAMLAFVRGEVDVFCSTTIVESGLDIPNANTIFLDDAHRYGLADLHQLRGRVGRADRRGYCYLLIPRGASLQRDARRRLKAIEELRYLGAGFQVALRDLEIRGAGNLLGPEQSGHIAAVGYETWRRLLAQAVARLKRSMPPPGMEVPEVADVALGVAAAVPPAWVPDEESRLALLRECDAIRGPKDVEDLLAGLKDRFGPPPPPVERLARLFFLKHRLGALGLDRIQWVDDRLLCTLRDARRFERSLRRVEVDLRVITPRQAHWVLPEGLEDGDAVLEYLYATAAACRPPRRRGESHSRRRRP